MKALIVYASEYGSTCGVAEAIAEALTSRGKRIDAFDAATAPPPGGYDAVTVGSGIYLGSWLKPAARYLEAHAGLLRQRPVWLFGVGPLGVEDPQPAGEPDQAKGLVERVAARTYVRDAWHEVRNQALLARPARLLAASAGHWAQAGPTTTEQPSGVSHSH